MSLWEALRRMDWAVRESCAVAEANRLQERARLGHVLHKDEINALLERELHPPRPPSVVVLSLAGAAVVYICACAVALPHRGGRFPVFPSASTRVMGDR